MRRPARGAVPAAVFLIALAGGTLPARPQEPGGKQAQAQRLGVSEEVRVTLRQIDFLALDGKGRPITDLRLGEVRLWEDGEEKNFLTLSPSHEPQISRPDPAAPGAEGGTSPGAAKPAGTAGRRWIVILIGARDLSLQSRIFSGEALADLVARELTPADRVSLVVDEDELRILVPFTTNKEALLGRLEHPESLSRSARDLERKLKELQDNAESCRDTGDVVGCARQAASSFVAETAIETETSLDHLETLVKAMGSIPDRKIVLYVSDGLILNPGDVGMAAVEHAIGQHGYNLSAMQSLLMRDFGPRLERLYQLAAEARVGFYPVSGIRKMTDEPFSVERTQGYGP